MLKLAIVENDSEQAARLEGYVRMFEHESGEKCDAVVFRDGVDIVSDYAGDFDGVFMDIDMPMMDGMTAAERIRETDERVCIVFVTDLAQYALRGYKVNALDYLVKPVDYFEFSVELKKMIRSKKANASEYIWLSTQGAGKRVSLQDIAYVDILAHDIRIHVDGARKEEIVFRGTLKDIEERLDGKPFSRCHNCYIVNLRYVTSVDGDEILLENGERVFISRNRRKKFMTDLTNYIAVNGGYSRKHGGGYRIICCPIPLRSFRMPAI